MGLYYRDVAKLRQIPCPAGGNLWLPVTVVREQFREFLAGVTLPAHWREEVHRRVVEQLEKAGLDSVELARERERLKLKRTRLLKQHREGYISDREMQREVAGVDLALSRAALPASVNGNNEMAHPHS